MTAQPPRQTTASVFDKQRLSVTTAPSILFKLPREVRDEIYCHVLGLPTFTSPRGRTICHVIWSGKNIISRFSPGDRHPECDNETEVCTEILRTCRTVSEECLSLLYSRMAFSFLPMSQDFMWGELLWFLDMIGEKNRQCLGEISVEAPWVAPLVESPYTRKPTLEGISWLRINPDKHIEWDKALGWEASPMAEVASKRLAGLTPGLRKFELVATAELIDMLWEEEGSEAANKAQFEALEKVAEAFRGTAVEVTFNIEQLSCPKVDPVIQRIVKKFGWKTINQREYAPLLDENEEDKWVVSIPDNSWW
ncbi:hypothetical protein FGG08_000556 [Glutinoglossum americanum]|uniref:DUF7730 domain-containing protein n=1 Tax=Glutinoglossum americanum TaxID=1670608 RepID=A0A9P8L5Z2_9PEZI|nr:hypothetical protein FGG08_000556 [Glutinoglossum americanum]